MRLASNHNETVLSGVSAKHNKPVVRPQPRYRLAGNHNETVVEQQPRRRLASNHNETVLSGAAAA